MAWRPGHCVHNELPSCRRGQLSVRPAGDGGGKCRGKRGAAAQACERSSTFGTQCIHIPASGDDRGGVTVTNNVLDAALEPVDWSTGRI